MSANRNDVTASAPLALHMAGTHETVRAAAEFLAREIQNDVMAPETEIADAIDQAIRAHRRGAQKELLKALRDAVRTIRTWHGMGMGASEAQAWALYQASPEMKRINAAIALAEGQS